MANALFLAEGFEEIESLATDILRRAGHIVHTVGIVDKSYGFS